MFTYLLHKYGHYEFFKSFIIFLKRDLEYRCVSVQIQNVQTLVWKFIFD